MDIRHTLADDAKAREGKESAVQQTLQQFQERFMAETGSNQKIAVFYHQQVKPLFEQKKSYESLQQIELQFDAIIKLFQQSKGIDVDILKGYSHILTFYKLLACFQFLQPNQSSRSSKEPFSPMDAKSEEPLSPAPVTLKSEEPLSSASVTPKSEESLSPVKSKSEEPLSPVESKSPGPVKAGAVLSKEFIALQLDSAQRHLIDYEAELKTWGEISFPLNERELKGEVEGLNKDILKFNEKLKGLTSLLEEKELVSDHKHKIEALLKAEIDYSIFSNGLQAVTLEHQQLTERGRQFEKKKEDAILSLENNDNLYCDQRRTARISIRFSEAERREVQGTSEFKKVTFFYSKKKEKYESKKEELESLDKNIEKLQIILGELLFEKENFLGKLLTRNRILMILSEFKTTLEMMFEAYRTTLREAIAQIDKLLADANERRISKIKILKRLCKVGIKEKVEGAATSFKISAISSRKQKRAGYVIELKSQLAAMPADDISLLPEIQKKREEQLDNKWRLEIEEILKGYRNQFLAIQASTLSSDELDKIHEKIQELDEFYRAVELRRYAVVRKMEEWDEGRREKVVRFFDPFFSLMKEIEKARIATQIDSYKIRYRQLLKELIFHKKISESKGLLRETQDFLLKYPHLDKPETVALKELIKDIRSRLSYHRLRQEQNKKEVRQYKKDLVMAISSHSGESVTVLEEAKKKLAEWSSREESIVREELGDQASLAKLSHIQRPITELAANIHSYSKPEYSWGWALFWIVITIPVSLGLLGYCIYQSWYNRKCRLAMTRHIASQAGGSGTTSQEASLPGSPVLVAKAPPFEATQDNEFTDFSLTGRQFSLPEEKTLSLSSSSSRMTQVMHASFQNFASAEAKGKKKKKLSVAVNHPVDNVPEIHTAHPGNVKRESGAAGVYSLIRSMTESRYPDHHYQRTRQRPYDLVSPERVADLSSGGGTSSRSPRS